MEVNFTARIPISRVTTLSDKVVSNAVATDAARNLLRSPDADIFTRATNPSKADPVLAEIARCNSLVLNKPEHPHPFMDIQEFLQVTAPFEHKVVGELPESMQRLFPKKPSDAITFLGELATFLRTQIGSKLYSSHPIKLASGKKFDIKYVDRGKFASVYKIGDGENQFAFKVFTNDLISEKEILENGSIAEARTDAYLCDNLYKDFRTFYMSDFSPKGKWTLSEFIQEPDGLTEIRALYNAREGVTLRSVHPEICFSDIYIPRNYLLGGQVRVDPGSANIPTKGDKTDMTALKKSYPELFPSPLVDSHPSIDAIKNLPGEQRVAAFESLVANSDPKIRHLVSGLIMHLPLKPRTRAYYDLLNHPDPAFKVGLGDQAKNLLYEDDAKALKAAIEHPDAPITVGMLKDVNRLLRYEEQKAMYAEIIKKVTAPYSTFSLG